jgi:MOSC domain-containing protein YiiM
MATVHRINVSAGGVPKRSVPSAEVGQRGVEGDRQAKPGIHGGIYKAVSLFALEVIERLAAAGHPIAPGSCGENLTIAGLDWASVVPGTRLRVGRDVTLKITSHATPCATIAGCFADGDVTRLHHRAHPGESRLYAQVLIPGRIAVGDAVEVCAVASAAPTAPQGRSG